MEFTGAAAAYTYECLSIRPASWPAGGVRRPTRSAIWQASESLLLLPTLTAATPLAGEATPECCTHELCLV
jgi:hypothetical protein